ncbi:ArsR/SmtB family transcription factor [Brevibacillus sp. SYSU BS000544]|uniref:ArsR/SmtB family transcription factor n=1 Tax=Brevibacillus sp. SYSU BS000544 TaxID=3416443 RepID=UPI003CE52CDD
MEPTDMMQILYMADLFKLLGDKTRLTILSLLYVQSMCVRDLVENIQASQPSVSQHLAKLRSHGIVKETRKGAWVYYSINQECKPLVKQILEQLPNAKLPLNTTEGQGISVAN